MAAEYEGIQNQQERHQLDIGKPGKADLQHQKDCGKKRVTDKFLCFHVVLLFCYRLFPHHSQLPGLPRLAHAAFPVPVSGISTSKRAGFF